MQNHGLITVFKRFTVYKKIKIFYQYSYRAIETSALSATTGPRTHSLLASRHRPNRSRRNRWAIAVLFLRGVTTRGHCRAFAAPPPPPRSVLNIHKFMFATDTQDIILDFKMFSMFKCILMANKYYILIIFQQSRHLHSRVK